MDAMILNKTSPGEWLVFVNDNTDGIMGLGIVMAIFIVLLLALKSSVEFMEAFTISAIITTILSMFLLSIGLISQGAIFILIFLIALGIFGIYTKS
jgi:hypothetical protein